MDLSSYSRIIVKVSSSVLFDQKLHGIRLSWFHSLIEDLAELHQEGVDIIVISSGAVALGKPVISKQKEPMITLRQASASIGQINLMSQYNSAFKNHDIHVAQILFSIKDKYNSIYCNNVTQTINTLLANRCVPVINENDAIAPQDFVVRDNDLVSAFFCGITKADLLVIFTDVDGLYNKDPKVYSDAAVIKKIDKFEEKYFLMGGVSTSLHGTGGIKSKLTAAEIASESGCDVILANGKYIHPLKRLAETDICTFIPRKVEEQERDVNNIERPAPQNGLIILNTRGILSIKHRKDIMIDDISSTQGVFKENTWISIADREGKIIGEGKVKFSNESLEMILSHLHSIQNVFSDFWDKRVILNENCKWVEGELNDDSRKARVES